MFPDHLTTLALVLIVAIVLYRWGVLIFCIYALLHFAGREWFEAGVAFALACFISFVQSFVRLLSPRAEPAAPRETGFRWFPN